MVRRTVVCVKQMQPAGQSWIEEGHWGLEVSNATGADEAEPLHLLEGGFLNAVQSTAGIGWQRLCKR